MLQTKRQANKLAYGEVAKVLELNSLEDISRLLVDNYHVNK